MYYSKVPSTGLELAGVAALVSDLIIDRQLPKIWIEWGLSLLRLRSQVARLSSSIQVELNECQDPDALSTSIFYRLVIDRLRQPSISAYRTKTPGF